MYKVLLVDDEPAMTESLKRVILTFPKLELLGCVYMASEAKQILEQETPDVLITDIRMPGGSGLELLQYAAQNHPSIVMIVVSGYDTFEYVRSAFIYGVEDYLLKPVSPNAFSVFLEKLIVKLENQVIEIPQAEKTDKTQLLSLTSPEEALLKKIEHYLLENLAEDNSMDTICKKFSINQPRLNKIFRKHKDCTYNEFLTMLRLSKAKSLLLTRQDLLIGTIATLCGFSDQFYFSKVFKSSVGVPPSEFRNSL